MNSLQKKFLFFASLLALATQINSQPINEIKPKTIVINPGHGPYKKFGFGAPGKDTSEYFLNLKVSNYIKNEFSSDYRFNIILTKDSIGFNQDLESKILNQEKLREIKTTMKLIKPEVVRGVKYRGSKKKTPGEILSVIYSTRRTAEDFLDPEIIISPHHDAATKQDSGYSILMSPRNYEYEQTEKLALNIANRLSKVSNVSTKIINDSLPNWPTLEVKRKEFEKKGVVFRTRLPELGDIRYGAKKPKLIIEYEFARRVSIKDEDYFKTRARATYLGILDYFNLKELTLDDRLKIELEKLKSEKENSQPKFFINHEIFSTTY